MPRASPAAWRCRSSRCLPRRERSFLALSVISRRRSKRLLLGVKRTSAGSLEMSACDPKRCSRPTVAGLHNTQGRSGTVLSHRATSQAVAFLPPFLFHLSRGAVSPARGCGLSRFVCLTASVVAAMSLFACGVVHAEMASIYGGSDGLCGSRTANGERLNCAAMTAAHRKFPFGTLVRVCHSGCVVVRINDRGPWVRGRDIDLSPAAGKAIGIYSTGHVTISTGL
jgi:rare lipoprotein A